MAHLTGLCGRFLFAGIISNDKKERPWAEITRPDYRRDGPCDASDLTDVVRP